MTNGVPVRSPPEYSLVPATTTFKPCHSKQQAETAPFEPNHIFQIIIVVGKKSRKVNITKLYQRIALSTLFANHWQYTYLAV